MKSKTPADWIARISISSAEVNAWLVGVSEKHWLNLVEETWTIKDLIGHLAAWSDFLVDQIDALVQGNFDKIKRIDIDHWNAAQIAVRRSRSVVEIRKEWERAVQRTQNVITQLPEEIFACRWSVAWSKEPVTIEDLLNLWLLHLQQHQEVWESTHQRRKK